ncbi:MAG: phosphoribosylanthranilate isomerase [Patiriisocius sp.]|jgi:phosphoribosylanthranilate isomerase
MSVALKIKVCGNAIYENAMAVSKLNPDMMGFVFYNKSSRYILPELALRIVDDIQSSIEKTGVFVNESIDSLIYIQKSLHLDVIQLHGDESPSYCGELKEKCSARIMKVFRVNEGFTFDNVDHYSSVVDCFLFDTYTSKYGGSGKKFNWNIMEQYKLNVPFYLSGGINIEDTQELKKLKLSVLQGIDVNSGFELSPALKDISVLEKFIKEIRL